MAELRISAGTFVWALQGICQLHRIPFAATLVQQQFPPPHDLASLQQAACALGLKSGLRESRAEELPDFPTPFVAVLSPAMSAGGSAPEDDAHRLAIVIKCDASGISWFEASSVKPAAAPLDEFAGKFAGRVLLCAPVASALKDEDAAAEARAGFGFRWFVPELLRHKSIWRDVMLASLAIQL